MQEEKYIRNKDGTYKKACCGSCAEGKECDGSSDMEQEKGKNIRGLLAKNYTLLGRGKKLVRADDDDELQDELNLKQTSRSILKKELARERNDNRQIDLIMDSSTFIEAMMRPDLHTNVVFPKMFNTPGTPVHMYNTLFLTTNANGVAWCEVNFGQYLGQSAFVANGAVAPATTDNTTATVGRSNVFFSDPNGTLDGISSYALTGNLITSPIGQYVPSNVMQENITTLNAVAVGPACVWYDFIGRLDISSGVVTAGINYTFATFGATSSDYNGGNIQNGLLPDFNYITLKSIEDCPYKLQQSVVDSFQGVFIPQDSQVLDLKNPQVANTFCQQRFFMIITGAAPNERIGQLKIAMNWDGKPNAQYANNISTSITRTAKFEGAKEAIDYIISSGNVLRTTEGKYGIQRFNKYFK